MHPKASTESYIAMKLNISKLALGGHAVLHPHGQTPEGAGLRDRGDLKDAPHSIFGQEAGQHRNILTIRLQPNGGHPARGDDQGTGARGHAVLSMCPSTMTFADALGPEAEDVPDAYERLIMDVIRGNQTLFMARRRGGGGLGMDRPDHRGMDRCRRAAP